MKNKNISVLFFLMIITNFSVVYPQDWIFKTDGSAIKCLVIKSSPEEVQYKKWEDTAKLFAIDRNYIYRIVEHDIYYPNPDIYTDPRKILLGIGTLIDTSDYTTATFDCFRFFADHPIVINGSERARIAVVDHPSEAEYAITGLIEGFTKLAMITDEIIPPYKYNYNLTLDINIWHNGKIIKKFSTNVRDYLSDENGKVISINNWPPGDLKYYFYYRLFQKAQKYIIEIMNQSNGYVLTSWNFEVPFIEPILTQTYITKLKKREIVFYPYKTTKYFSKDREMDPWEELSEFDINFKVGLPFEKYHSIGYHSSYSGIAQFNFPVSSRPEAALEYIQIGDNFFRLHQDYMASKCYWASLTLISKTFSSRPVKEKLRLLCYAGLYNVAIRENKNQYASLLKVAIDMIDIYLKGQQGIDDDAIFNWEMEKVRTSEQLKVKTERTENWNQIFSAFQTGMSMAQGINNASGLTSPTDIINSGINLMGQMESQNSSLSQSIQLTEEINQRLTNNYKSLKSQIGIDETTSLAGGGNFLSKEVVFFLATSNSTDPYIRLLNKFSAKYLNLQSAINQFENNYDPIESVLKIGEEINKIEKDIIQNEILMK